MDNRLKEMQSDLIGVIDCLNADGEDGIWSDLHKVANKIVKEINLACENNDMSNWDTLVAHWQVLQKISKKLWGGE